MKKKQGKDSVWVMFAWGLNIAGVFAIIFVAMAYFYLQNVSAAPQDVRPIYTITVPPTFTQDPASLWLPTITPNPRSTMIVVQSPTPFVIPNFALQANARISVIGYSVSGRPLEVYTFGHGEKEKMIVAGIHGGYEWNTIALADELIQHIFDNPEIIPSDVTLHILRNMNPDGDARDHGIDGRVNDHGVDLNRNFPSNWARTWDRTGCWTLTRTTGGTGPGSEPETKAVMYFLWKH
jgi:murein tripeptide amidase MpaA